MLIRTTCLSPQPMLVLCIAHLVYVRACAGAVEGRCEVGFGNLPIPNGEQFSESETQYIVPDMKFTCDGSIAEWNITARVPWGPPRSITLQLWRVQGTSANGVTYSLVTSQVFSTSSALRTTSTVLTFTPTPEMSFSSGDVVGFHIPTRKLISPLSVLFDGGATNFTMYKESCTRIAPEVTADISSSFSAISNLSPLISVRVRASTACIRT